VIGRTLAHYRIVRKLGSGGMGDVYLAEDTVLGRSIALKVLTSDAGHVPDGMRRFTEEARAASALNHPNIATIHELGEADGLRFIVMEYVQGATLKQKVSTGPLDPSSIAALGCQIADALQAAHESGIIHRDIKPSNIMITPQARAKVLDFGIAKRVPRAQSDDLTCEATDVNLMIGTVPYMSPEQALGRLVEERSDIFSLGVVLYEMATGRLPFSGSNPYDTIDRIVRRDPEPIAAVNPNIPAALEQIIHRCLEKSPVDRFSSAAELSSQLAAVANGGATAGRRRTSCHNLPHQLTRFIGRQRDIAAIRDLLKQTRLLTLSGPAGIGKTRLALEVAADLIRDYADGVYLVELGSLVDSALIPQTVASTLGVREERGQSIAQTTTDYLKERHLLLVLDNCEHVIDACAQLSEGLLRSARKLCILATSRESLGITGETIFRVPPLSVPDIDGPADVPTLAEHEAVELFVDRARAVKPNFAIDHANAVPLRELCNRLEGIPLAIELAASRVKVLLVQQIADRLGDRLHLLTGGNRTALPRYQALAAAIDWSYDLLSEKEKTLFRRLSVFSGGWTLEAAERVCDGGGVHGSDVLELLAGLIDKSLVFADERDGRQRYRFMVTIWEYAAQRLTQTDEDAAVHRAHADLFGHFAIDAESKLKGTDQKIWLERLTADYDNIRAVLSWATTEDLELGLRVVGALRDYWYFHGYWTEGRQWLSEMLALVDPYADAGSRAKALNAAALMAEFQGDGTAARPLAEQALSLSRESSETRETALALNTLAITAADHGNFALARKYLEESLAIRRELEDAALVASTLNNLGILSCWQGEFVSAQSLFDESLAMARKSGDRHGTAMALLNRAEVATRVGDLGFANSLANESLAVAKDMEDRTLVPKALHALAKLSLLHGDDASAAALIEESLESFRRLGDKRWVAIALTSLGMLAEHRGKEEARSLFEESVSRFRGLGDRPELITSLNRLGRALARQGDYDAARSCHEEALRICREIGAHDRIPQSLSGLANAARSQADHAGAAAFYREALTIAWKLGAMIDVPPLLEGLATVIASQGEIDRAVRLSSAADGLRDRISVPRQPDETAEHDRFIQAARDVLHEDGFAAAWSLGQAAATDVAIADALQYAPSSSGKS
jgi:predicted ATPase/tRNA A-37 threonylcarbamoyl transferase component Bud32/Tfp pilus assembly protein PilF